MFSTFFAAILICEAVLAVVAVAFIILVFMVLIKANRLLTFKLREYRDRQNP